MKDPINRIIDWLDCLKDRIARVECQMADATYASYVAENVSPHFKEEFREFLKDAEKHEYECVDGTLRIVDKR